MWKTKRGPGALTICQQCGKEFVAAVNKLKIGKGKFCSPECGYKGRPRPEWMGDKNPAWKGGTTFDKAGKAKRYRQRNPEKHHAHRAVSYAIKKGKLVAKPCEVCGISARVHAHHPDYSKPLDVVWLCEMHHLEVHGCDISKLGEGACR